METLTADEGSDVRGGLPVWQGEPLKLSEKRLPPPNPWPKCVLWPKSWLEAMILLSVLFALAGMLALFLR